MQNLRMQEKLSTRRVCGLFSPVHLNHLKAVICKLDEAIPIQIAMNINRFLE